MTDMGQLYLLIMLLTPDKPPQTTFMPMVNEEACQKTAYLFRWEDRNSGLFVNPSYLHLPANVVSCVHLGSDVRP